MPSTRAAPLWSAWWRPSPEAIRYWERAYDGKILDPSEKYGIESYPEGLVLLI